MNGVAMESRLKTLPNTDKARKQSLALYRTDLEDLERIRVHYGLDSLSQAARRAIRNSASVVAFESSRNGRAA
jgi:hypothetical protein